MFFSVSHLRDRHYFDGGRRQGQVDLVYRLLHGRPILFFVGRYCGGLTRSGPPIGSRNTLGKMKKVMIVDRKTISIMKACELVGVSRRTIYNWISSGKVEYVRTAGGSIRIFVDTLWRKPEEVSRRDLVGEQRRSV